MFLKKKNVIFSKRYEFEKGWSRSLPSLFINIKRVSDLCYFKMCFCDGYSFLIVNKNTEEKQIIKGDEKLVEFFESRYSLPCLFHKLLKNEYVHHNGALYHLSYNSHPDCQRVKMQLVKGLGIEDPGLWRICPKEYRNLLHDERRQELNKPVKNNILKC